MDNWLFWGKEKPAVLVDAGLIARLGCYQDLTPIVYIIHQMYLYGQVV